MITTFLIGFGTAYLVLLLTAIVAAIAADIVEDRRAKREWDAAMKRVGNGRE